MDPCCYFSIYSMKEINIFGPRGAALIRDSAGSLCSLWTFGWQGQCLLYDQFQLERQGGMRSQTFFPCLCDSTVLLGSVYILRVCYFQQEFLKVSEKKKKRSDFRKLTIMHLNLFVSSLNRLNFTLVVSKLIVSER